MRVRTDADANLKLAIFTVAGFESFLVELGLPAILAWPVILGELIGGLALMLGVYARFVSLLLLPVLLGAVYIHAPNGWLFTAENGGWDYPAFLAFAALAQALIGGDAYALTSSRNGSDRRAAITSSA